MAKIVHVDQNDTVVGAGTRQEATEKGLAARIVRIFLFNSKGEVLIQKRAEGINNGGKWDQSAAGHVDEGEDYLAAAYREMLEEIGVEGISLTEITKLYLEETTASGAIAKRFHMLYTGTYNGEITPNPKEVTEVRWILPADLVEWMERKPEEFTEGFRYAFQELMRLNKN